MHGENLKLIYAHLLQYKRRKPPTCFGHLSWPSSGRYYTKDILKTEGYIKK